MAPLVNGCPRVYHYGRMLKVGITGGLASGKSLIASELERLGAVVIRADELGHQALARGGAAFEATVARFGIGILAPSGEIDRAALGRLVFPNPAALEQLNRIVHPAVHQREEELTAAAAHESVVVIEAAILIETGSYKNLDRLVIAHCTEAQQRERALRRPGATPEDVAARLARQMPLQQKLAFADFVIDTSGTEEATLRQTRELFATLKGESA